MKRIRRWYVYTHETNVLYITKSKYCCSEVVKLLNSHGEYAEQVTKKEAKILITLNDAEVIGLHPNLDNWTPEKGVDY